MRTNADFVLKTKLEMMDRYWLNEGTGVACRIQSWKQSWGPYPKNNFADSRQRIFSFPVLSFFPTKKSKSHLETTFFMDSVPTIEQHILTINERKNSKNPKSSTKK